MALVNLETDEVISNEQAQEWIRLTLERCGRLIMSAPVEPLIGEVQEFAGLPWRVVCHVSIEEAKLYDTLTADIWGSEDFDGQDFYFEVQVAD